MTAQGYPIHIVAPTDDAFVTIARPLGPTQIAYWWDRSLDDLFAIDRSKDGTQVIIITIGENGFGQTELELLVAKLPSMNIIAATNRYFGDRPDNGKNITYISIHDRNFDLKITEKLDELNIKPNT